MRFRKTLLLAVLQCALAGVLCAQSVPAAFTPSNLYVGAQPTTVNPDWGCSSHSPFSCWDRQLLGVGAYAGVNRMWNRVGLEANVRFLSWRGVRLPSGSVKENTFVAGPTFRMYYWRSLSVAGNFMVGMGSITIPKGFGPGQGNYLVYNPAVHIDQRITRNMRMRYEYEYQFWPGFTGSLGNHGLTPNGLGVGVTYTLHPRTY